jgi:hypothetical protein
MSTPVLFVDDNEIMREVWPLLLTPLGLDVLLVSGNPTSSSLR